MIGPAGRQVLYFRTSISGPVSVSSQIHTGIYTDNVKSQSLQASGAQGLMSYCREAGKDGVLTVLTHVPHEKMQSL